MIFNRQDVAPGAQAMEATGMTQDIVDKLQEKAKVLTGERRKRSKVVPEELATADNIRSFKTLASHPGLHSASTPGILSVDINANNTSKILTGGKQKWRYNAHAESRPMLIDIYIDVRSFFIGADKTAAVFNKDDEQVVAILKGHSKKVNRVIYHPNGENNVITASYDGTIRIWDVPTSQVLSLLIPHTKTLRPKITKLSIMIRFIFSIFL